MIKVRLLTLCYILFSVSLPEDNCLLAQGNISYEQFTSENGLSENVVYCIHQDKLGFIWIGTDYGLNRFDGYNFRQYNQVNTDSTSLSNSSILCISEDELGKFWIGTYGGLNYFDPVSGHAERISLPDHGQKYSVYDIYNAGNGNLFLVTGPSYAYLFNIANRVFTKLSLPEPVNIMGYHVFRFPGNQHGILIAHKNDSTQIALLNNNNATVVIKTVQEMFPFADEPTLEYYFNDSHGNHFLSTFEDRSFNVYNMQGDIIASTPEELLNKPMQLHVYCMTEVDANQVWIGTNLGLLVYHNKEKKISIPELVGDSKSLPGNKEIRAIFQDRNSNAWIGVFGEGLLKCDNRPNPFRHVTLPEISQNKLARMIFGLHTWPGNLVGVETTYGNISLIKEGKAIDFLSMHDLTLDQVIYMTVGKSFSKLSDFQKKCLTRLANQYNGFQTRLIVLPDDTTVIEGENGLTIHMPGRDTTYRIDVNNVIVDGDYYWIASYDGLHRIDKLLLKDTAYRFEQGNPFSLSENSLYYVTADKENNLWIGTKGGGLTFFDRNQNKFFHFTTEDGLPDNVVYFILPDDQGNLWLTTNKGISRFNIKERSFCNYNRRDGLLNTEFNRLGGIRTTDGYIYFAGTNGIDYFKPDEVETIRNINAIYITGWKVNEDEKQLMAARPFRYDQNNMVVNFTTNDFVRPDLIYFHYRLHPDQSWTRIQGRYFATFSGLQPGRYNFEVQASYDNLHWSPGASQQFTIRPPWWRSWWFFTFCGVFIASGFYFFYRYKIEQLKRVQKMRSRISRDLHDEVGSTLSSIHVYSSLAEKAMKKNPEATIDALKHINTNSKQVMENMSDIVWAINTGKDGEISLEKKLKNYGFELLTPLGIITRYVIDHEAEGKLIHIEARKNVLLITKEAMNNIARYSKATEASVRLELLDHHLQLSIEDNGIGFNTMNGRKGNGLHNMKKRTENMGGKFRLSSEPNRGTKISCRFTLASISDTGYRDGY